jgi:hypothetical protein
MTPTLKDKKSADHSDKKGDKTAQEWGAARYHSNEWGKGPEKLIKKAKLDFAAKINKEQEA